MKNSQLDRLLRFAQRTGDRLIITDAEGKEPVVILSLDEYEALLNGKTAAPAPRAPKTESRAQMAEDDDEQVDLTEIEAAVEAVNREATPEPKVVPITRKTQASEPGEEQFYMEPI